MSHSHMLGQAPEFQAVLRAAALVAATRAPVLIRGESGTGKELLAQAIHRQGNRRHAPFVAINCAALPEALAEAELFGHRKGAFTGAHAPREGRILAAHGGTLFLDEIGELAPTVQAKLLRFLESGECQVVGAEHSRRVEVRVIAATNADLEAQVRQGGFRNDLYYRLRVVPLELPPLRQRSGDVELLLDHFLQTAATAHGSVPVRFSPAARRLLLTYSWPGNVRELRNLCERMAILHAGTEILPEHLPGEFHPEAALPVGGVPSMGLAACFALPDGGINLEELERHLICEALEKTSGNRTHAARLLHLSRDALLYRMKKHALRP